MNHSNPINIVTGADDKYAMSMAVTLYSAVVNLPQDRYVSLYIMDGGLSERNKLKLNEVLTRTCAGVRIEWLQPDLLLLEGIHVASWLRPATYLRLFIPEILPSDCERALYLDSDLVVEKDLAQIYESPMDDIPALGIYNYNSPLVGDKKEDFQIASVFGLDRATSFCNCGVLVMNLGLWRTEHLGRRALELARQYPLPESDQDAINILVAGRWGLLDPKWNVQLSVVNEFGHFLKRSLDLSDDEMRHRCDDLVRDPHIIHYTGLLKPWHLACTEPLRSRFFHYLALCGWFDAVYGRQDLVRRAWNEQKQYDPWFAELYRAREALEQCIPPGDGFILVDDRTWYDGVVAGWHITRFFELAGPPEDDAQALREYQRLERAGANFIVFARPAFWWLEYYRAFHAHLQQRHRCIVKEDQLVVFDLRS
jgi:lipopolysaccharide biosynthesis glycosyltransferase